MMNINHLSTDPDAVEKRRQALYWKLLASVFGQEDQAENLGQIAQNVALEVSLPHSVLDTKISIENLKRRHPNLETQFDQLMPPGVQDPEDEHAAEEGEKDPTDTQERHDDPSFDDAHAVQTLPRALLLSKMLVNVFGPNASMGVVSAAQYNQWVQDVGEFERSCGFAPGQLRRGGGAMPQGGDPNPSGRGPRPQYSFEDQDVAETLKAMEKDIVGRMALREVLQDSKLVEKLNPSMALVEQLLADKSNLSGVALSNAKALIRRFVDDLTKVLLLEVEKASVGKIDRSVPPKRVYRNLDLKRTIWKNLHNWNAERGKLYVDKLFYKHTAVGKLNTRLIIVIDQSGSMLDSMVNCAILGSIFAGLPNVDAHLIAYDTQAIDLTGYVKDPFEVLLRTKLGGGNDWHCAMEPAEAKIIEPKKTALIWISDFYEIDTQQMMNKFKALKQSGVKLLPVGSVSSSGYYSVQPWFKQQFKQLGTPVISGSVKTLIKEIKQFVATA